MKILKIIDAEGCIDGNIGLDIYFDTQIDFAFSDYLGKLGKYIVHSDFDKPFFKVIVRGYYTLKGSVGNESVRLLVPETISKEIIEGFVDYVSNYR